MQEQVAWAEGKAEAADALARLESLSEAYHGRLATSLRLSRHAEELVIRADRKEAAADSQLDAGLRQALFGNLAQEHEFVQKALTTASGRDERVLASVTLALTHNADEAGKLADKINQDYSSDTLVQGYWLPTIRAAVELQRHNPQRAIEFLEAALPYELGADGQMLPVFVRGEAYLQLKRGSDAAREFQKIIDHPGIVVNSPTGALARLGLARAYAVSADSSRSRTAYQDFFALWKDADPDIPVLKEAQSEYKKVL